MEDMCDSKPEDRLLRIDRDDHIEKEVNTSNTLSHRSTTRRNRLISAFISLILLLAIGHIVFCKHDSYISFPWLHQDDASSKDVGDQYLLGVGKADITGPVVEINMMGYADPKQVGSGIRQRLYCRAFIIGDVKKPEDRFVYLVLDTQSGDTAVRNGILAGLADAGLDDLYGQHNIAVTGTHSHSGPGGWLNYLLPQITSKGFDHQSYRAIVDGALQSIMAAHLSLAPGYLSVGTTKVAGANINRSLFAYLANPESERNRYNISSEEDGSVETDMTLLKLKRASDSRNIGVLTWFPTHGTSMLGNNTLITGDNKGVAAYLFEKHMQHDDTAAENFVAGFSQASVGDTSPNVLGAWCEDGTGSMCSFENSTCSDGKSQQCHARGPFFRAKDNGAQSCFEIGRRQAEAAIRLYKDLDEKPVPVTGSKVDSFHTFHNMSNFSFQLPNGTEGRTCPAALGYSFAAGTSDGPGAFDFTQHDGGPDTTSPMWAVVRHLLKEPSEEQKACHGAKPILLDVGEISTPYQWTPNIVDIQVFRVGQFFMIISPGEATTMAGRRWKEAVHDYVKTSFESSSPPVVVLGGPANSYTHYITTQQEYDIQRYEGASTLYGPYTLDAYIDVTLQHLPLLDSQHPKASTGPLPPDNTNKSLSFISPVVRDGTPFFKSFGQVLNDVHPSYQRSAVISATFVGANPRNNLRLGDTYAAVERLFGRDGHGNDIWQRVLDDADWALVFEWKRINTVLATSEVTITWETSVEDQPGEYRLRYFGDAKGLGGSFTPFEGASSIFKLE